VFLEPARVHLGFTRDVPEDELAAWVEEQDAAAMLGVMHVLTVEEGDAVLVPAGLPHAIGEGAFLVELQEPTDLSILLEWAGFAIDGKSLGHLGLGFQTALGAVDRGGWSWGEIEDLRGARAGDAGDLLPDSAEFAAGPCRVERDKNLEVLRCRPPRPTATSLAPGGVTQRERLQRSVGRDLLTVAGLPGFHEPTAAEMVSAVTLVPLIPKLRRT
jgi:hypothetical protein